MSVSYEDKLYGKWWNHPSETEQTMEEQHRSGWNEFIEMIREQDLSAYEVLDFGCNQGGFLRHLYGVRPFRRGLGIDLATESIGVANQRRGDLPVEYVATTTPEIYAGRFELAVSMAVLYLIPDLSLHAWKVKQTLKPSGIYYATYTDMSQNPSREKYWKWIDGNGAVKAQNHSLDDIVRSFAKEGFQVEMRRRIPKSYVVVGHEEEGFACVGDHMKAVYEDAYVFRFTSAD